MNNLAMHENTAQNIIYQYKNIGILLFCTGLALSIIMEFELIAILLKLPSDIIPQFIRLDMPLSSSIFYLILGNLMMLIEYQFFRKNQLQNSDQ